MLSACLINVSASTAFTAHSFNSKKTPWPQSLSELYWPSDRRLSAKLVPTFEDRGRHVVSVTDPLRPYSRISRPQPLLFLPSSSSVVLKRPRGPRSRLTTTQKILQSRESNPDPWICSQTIWPLDHRGGTLNLYLHLYIQIWSQKDIRKIRSGEFESWCEAELRTPEVTLGPMCTFTLISRARVFSSRTSL
jgi:hypothetical protein